jgi:hypothetical protein
MAWSKAYENRKKGQIDIIQIWTTIEYRRIEGLCLSCSIDVSDWSIFFRNVVSDWTVILCFDWSVVYELEISDWFLFLYSDWWMSDRLKYRTNRRHLADGRHSATQTSPGRKHILGVNRMERIQESRLTILERCHSPYERRSELTFGSMESPVLYKGTNCLSSGSLSSNNGMICFSSFHSRKCKATPLLVGR